jgi:hypothetical protein
MVFKKNKLLSRSRLCGLLSAKTVVALSAPKAFGAVVTLLDGRLNPEGVEYE